MFLFIILPLLFYPGVSSAGYTAERCAELYLKRNRFYHRKGLCFTRDTANMAFPNNRYTCTITSSQNLPISANEKRWVDSIVEEERYLGCPRMP